MLNIGHPNPNVSFSVFLCGIIGVRVNLVHVINSTNSWKGCSQVIILHFITKPIHMSQYKGMLWQHFFYLVMIRIEQLQTRITVSFVDIITAKLLQLVSQNATILNTNHLSFTGDTPHLLEGLLDAIFAKK